MTEHSEVGGSAAHRFFPCPGSVALCRGLPNPDTEFSERGHRAHTEAAFVLEFGGEPKHEDAWAIKEYLELITSLRTGGGVEYIEHHFHVPEIDDRMRGTIDYALVGARRGVVVDYKHGEGVWVDVRGNAQLLYYAAALAYEHPEVEEWELIICQPRAGGTSQMTISVGVLGIWIEDKLKPALAATLDPNAPLVPGEKQCQFCPAKVNAVCPALHQQVAVIQELPPAASMSDEEIDALLPKLPTAKMLIKALEGEAYKRAMNGTVFTNGKLVEGKTDRAWKEGVTVPYYSDPVPLSPAQVEKLGPEGKAFAKEHAYKPTGRPTFVASTNARAAIAPPSKENWDVLLEHDART